MPGFFRQGNLPATLERLGQAGLRDLYEGEVAASIAADIKALGGVLSAEDLRACQPRPGPRRGRLARPHPSAHRRADRRADAEARVGGDGRCTLWRQRPSAAWYVALARAMKAAYAERFAGLGEGEPDSAQSCTTHLTVCDAEGTTVAMTTTLMSSMGSRVLLPQSGILLNNGMMWFDPRPGTPNAIAPGKRPLCNMLPIMLTEGGKPFLAAGASGGRRIMAAVFQLMTFIADFRMGVEAAAHHPRIDVSGVDRISADRRLPAAVLDALAAEGPVEVVEHGAVPINFACPNTIVHQADGCGWGSATRPRPGRRRWRRVEPVDASAVSAADHLVDRPDDLPMICQ